MKTSYGKLLTLKNLYLRLTNAEIEDFDEARSLFEDAKKIDSAIEPFESLRQKIVKKYGLEAGARPNTESLNKADADFVKLLETDTDIDLGKISKRTLSISRIKGVEANLLSELDLIKVEQ